MNCSTCNYALDPLDDQCPKCAVQQRSQAANPQPLQANAPVSAAPATVAPAPARPVAAHAAPAGAGSTLPPGRGNNVVIDETDIIDDDKVARMRQMTKIGVGLLVVAVIGFFLSRGLQPQPLEAPASFASFTAGDKSFSCDAPANWDNSTATKGNGVAGNATFKAGAAKIEVKSDLAGSLWGDISRTSVAGATTPQKSPVQKVHEMSTEAMSQKFINYEEMSGTSFQSRLGETWVSEFTADGGFRVGKLRGYRVTMLGGERRYTVVCQCPEADWETLKPAFDRIRDSVVAIPT